MTYASKASPMPAAARDILVDVAVACLFTRSTGQVAVTVQCCRNIVDGNFEIATAMWSTLMCMQRRSVADSCKC